MLFIILVCHCMGQYHDQTEPAEAYRQPLKSSRSFGLYVLDIHGAIPLLTPEHFSATVQSSQ